ncbi:restriction endonuclease PLD domain-containing protein [uncultured Corynebacterium sp.]|uniref:restriction endonuclease PLD domain-containing protein n=1 Tax=uncultured Corynebacterium sp. TaxID=159447 RepID=UPI002596EC9E|nr:restriction endonuclease PLD domain-containing protein [uncultured Corynebacterium sp.]
MFLKNTPNPKYNSSLSSEFWDHANVSRQIKIAVGYVGASSIIALRKYLELNPAASLELFIGMQYLEGFSEKQLYALEKLQQLLIEREQGTILLSKRVRHHAKFYYFDHAGITGNESSAPCVYIGSANLESITKGYNRTYEAGLILEDNDGDFNRYFERDIRPLGTKTDFAQITPTLRDESPLAQYEEAEPVSDDEVVRVTASKSTHHFVIPLKAEAKSHLNVFFGTPRKNTSTGRDLARPWYEVEVMPGKAITSSDGYPRNKEFTVITDDHWKFNCKTSGDGSKNLRSANNLMVLGAWIKGRLETYEALKIGDRVTPETFEKYGRSNFDMIYYPDHDIWYLDFSRKG